MRKLLLDKGVEIDINYEALPGNEEIVLQMHPFLDIRKATAYRMMIEYSKDSCIIQAAKKSSVFWEDERLPDISYEEVVKTYIEDYSKRIIGEINKNKA